VTSIRLPDGDLPLQPVGPDQAHLVLAAVARSAVFCTLPPPAYKKLLPFFRLGAPPAGTVLIQEGDRPHALFMVVSGAVSARDTRRGPGSCFGGIGHGTSAAEDTVVSRGDALIAVLTPAQVRVLSRALPELSLDD
jgi:hypothetical protein